MAVNKKSVAEQGITCVQMITGFRTEMQMTDRDWYSFCLRYSTRSLSTVVLFFEDIYTTVPYGFQKALRSELVAGVKNYAPVHTA